MDTIELSIDWGSFEGNPKIEADAVRVQMELLGMYVRVCVQCYDSNVIDRYLLEAAY